MELRSSHKIRFLPHEAKVDGWLGFFLGASIFSLVEVFFFVLLLFRIASRKVVGL